MVTEEKTYEDVGEFYAPDPNKPSVPTRTLVPEGWFLFRQAKVVKAEPSELYPNSKRMSIRYQIDDTEKHKLPPAPEGLEQGDSVFERFGVTLNSERGKYRPRVDMHLGERSDIIERWFNAQGPLNPAWLDGAAIKLHIIHGVGEKSGREFASADKAMPPSEAEQTNTAITLLYKFNDRDPDLFKQVYRTNIDKLVAFLKAGVTPSTSAATATATVSVPAAAKGDDLPTMNELAPLPWDEDE